MLLDPFEKELDLPSTAVQIGNRFCRQDKVIIKGIMTAEMGCAVFDALHILEAADKIILIDAMKAGGPPGSVYLCDIVDIDENQEKGSLHHLSVITALHSLYKEAGVAN